MPYFALDVSTAAAAPVTTLGAPLVSVGETLGTLRTELKAQIIRADVNDDTRWNKWINQAYRHLASMLTLNELNGSIAIPTVVGQPLYGLPRAVGWIKNVPLADTALFPLTGGRNMQQIDLASYRDLSDPPTSYNFSYGPYKYFRYNRALVLWPTPRTVQSVAVDFRIRPTDLTADNHSPILPEELHESILLRARVVAFRALRMFNEAGLAQNDFVDSVRELLDTDAEESASSQPTLTPFTYRSSDRLTSPNEDIPDWAR